MSEKTTIHLGEARTDLDRKCEAYGMGQSAFIRHAIKTMPERPSIGSKNNHSPAIVSDCVFYNANRYFVDSLEKRDNMAKEGKVRDHDFVFVTSLGVGFIYRGEGEWREEVD